MYKRQEQERELKRAEQIRQELRKKRAARMSREYAQIFERPPSGGPAFCGRKADGVLGPGETPLGTADAAAGAPLPEAGPGAAVTGGTIAPAAAAVEPNLAAAFSAGVSEVAASVIDVMA